MLLSYNWVTTSDTGYLKRSFRKDISVCPLVNDNWEEIPLLLKTGTVCLDDNVNIKTFMLTLFIAEQVWLRSHCLCFLISRITKGRKSTFYTHWSKWQLNCCFSEMIKLLVSLKVRNRKAFFLISNEQSIYFPHHVSRCASLGCMSIIS